MLYRRSTDISAATHRNAATKVNVVFAADKNFTVPLQVAAASVAANALDKNCLRIWISTDSAESGAEDMIQRIACSSSVDVQWLPLDVSLIAQAPLAKPWSRATYLRILLASSLPSHVDRFIYLDSDIVVERDLQDLYAVDLGGTPVAAVRSFIGAPRGGPIDFSRYPYFNAGVMVIDRDVWIERQIAPRAIECIGAHPEGLRFMDQDALNAAVAGDWTPLDLRWNQRPYAWELSHLKMGISPEEMQTLRTSPFIIHFSGLAKPWKFGDDHPLRGRFVYYSILAGLSLPHPIPENFLDLLRWGAKLVVPRRARPVVRDALLAVKRLFGGIGIRW